MSNGKRENSDLQFLFAFLLHTCKICVYICGIKESEPYLVQQGRDESVNISSAA